MFYAGLDLGQSRDHSAIAVIERVDSRRAFRSLELEAVWVRHLERVPLGTSYPRVVSRISDILCWSELRGRCSLAVDATGVGAPVVDMLRAARIGCEISALTITGGERTHSYSGSGGAGWSVPKQDLIAGVQVLLERGELRIARQMRDAAPLSRELLDMRGRQGRSGRMKVGADGSGEHDDLVIALALACWSAGRKQVGFGNRRLPGF